MSLVTLQDVAQHAGVSLATASRVLNPGLSGRVVNADLAARVVASAETLRYIPNAHAQNLASRSMNPIVGVITHDISDPYFAEISSGALRAAMAHNVLVLLACTYRDPEQEIDYVLAMHRQRAQAIILAGSGFRDAHWTSRLDAAVNEYREGGGRVAVISQQRFGADAVLPDNAGGASKLAESLLQLGHREFAIITGPKHLLTVHDRYRAFTRALRLRSTDIPKERVVDGGFTRDGGYDAVHQLHARAALSSATCLVVLSDVMALGAMAALRDIGISVPEDLSVAGFDDIPAVRDLSPALTTVHLAMEDMGAQAIELVFGAQTVGRSPRSVRIDADVVMRESTASPSRSLRVDAG